MLPFCKRMSICFANSVEESFGPPHDKTNNMAVRPAKTQISLGIRPVWSESSLSDWRRVGTSATHCTHSEGSEMSEIEPVWGFQCYRNKTGSYLKFKEWKDQSLLRLQNICHAPIKCFPRGGGGGGYCYSMGVGQQRESIYLFMISDPLSSVIEIENLGIRQPNQSLPSRIWQGQDLRCFS